MVGLSPQGQFWLPFTGQQVFSPGFLLSEGQEKRRKNVGGKSVVRAGGARVLAAWRVTGGPALEASEPQPQVKEIKGNSQRLFQRRCPQTLGRKENWCRKERGSYLAGLKALLPLYTSYCLRDFQNRWLSRVWFQCGVKGMLNKKEKVGKGEIFYEAFKSHSCHHKWEQFINV